MHGFSKDIESMTAWGHEETKMPVAVKVGFMAKTGNLRAQLLLSPTLQTLR